MGKEKLKHCQVCGEEIAASVKVCPKCGAKNKKPIYQRGWFIAIVIVFFIAVAMNMGGNHEEVTQEISYTAYTVDQLMDDLDKNAANASDTYKNQYVELTGRVDVFDSDGKYIGVYPMKNQWTIFGVRCYIKNDEQKEFVKSLEKGATVIVRGKITDVGELIGYRLDINEIEKK